MKPKDIIKRVYGKHFAAFSHLIDEFGRLQHSKLEEFKDDESLKLISDMAKDIVFGSYIENGISYMQPMGLQDMQPKKLLTEDKDFIDELAREVMKIYVALERPASFADSIKISRIAYKQAISMWKVRTEDLQGIIDGLNLKIKV